MQIAFEKVEDFDVPRGVKLSEHQEECIAAGINTILHDFSNIRSCKRKTRNLFKKRFQYDIIDVNRHEYVLDSDIEYNSEIFLYALYSVVKEDGSYGYLHNAVSDELKRRNVGSSRYGLFYCREELIDFFVKFNIAEIREEAKNKSDLNERIVFLKDKSFTRYCLWLVGKRPSDYAHIPELTERFKYISAYRMSSPVDRIQKTADRPYLFTQNRQPDTDYLFIPRVSSSSRRYIPVGFMPSTVIASDAAVLVNNATIYDFGIISSSTHNAWMRVVAGRLKNDYRYAPSVYYNYPFPKANDEQKKKVEASAYAILEARKLYSDKCLADMYGENMYLFPELLQAHRDNDAAVLEAYGFPKNATESDIVARLFKMYQELTENK